MPWHSLRSARLPGESPIHMLNPSSGRHLQSQLWCTCFIPVLVHTQFWCTSFIWIINVILRPALIPPHSLHLAMPCQGQAPGPPSTHFLFQFWYTCLFSLLLLMFYLNYQTYTLACTNGMALTALRQLAIRQAPWTSQSTCLIPVLTLILS